jgi:hypothetical protein
MYLKNRIRGHDFIRLVRYAYRDLVGPVKCGAFFDYPETYCFLVKECAP